MNALKPALFPLCLSLVAQTPDKEAPKKAPKAAASAQKPAAAKPTTRAKAAPKDSPETQAARQALQNTLDAIDAAWFGKTYQGYNAVDVQGNLGITLSAATINAKVTENTGGQVKGGLTKGGNANLTLKGTYFANGDFKTDMKGDFGSLTYFRVQNKGFLYSKEQNAYTTRVDPPPSDAPLTYLGWFRQVLNDVKAVYVDASTFTASQAKEDDKIRTLVFNAPTGTYDPKKREQGLSDSLGFWKRGRMELVVDKTSKLPQRMDYSNESQGVRSSMTFTYGENNKLQSVSIANQSRGMEGPGNLQLAYGPDGLMSQISGQLASDKAKVSFSFSLAWAKDRKPSSIVTVPPLGSSKKGREEMETMLLVNLAGQILDLQRNGLNLRSVTLTGK